MVPIEDQAENATLQGVNSQEIARFQDWLVKRGRSPDTALEYARDVEAALSHPGDIEGRLGDKRLSPLFRHRIRASLKSWGLFTEDASLQKRLADIRLPPAARKAPRKPLSMPDWQKLIEEIDESEELPEPVRACLGIMAVRGLRVGDVLRLRHADVDNAIETGVLSFVAKGSKILEYTAKPVLPYLKILASQKKWGYVYDLVMPRTGPENRLRSGRVHLLLKLRKVAESAGVSADYIYTHQLRRTFSVYYLRELKGDPEALVKLQKYMGWSNIQTAAGYVDYIERGVLDEVGERLFRKQKDR